MGVGWGVSTYSVSSSTHRTWGSTERPVDEPGQDNGGRLPEGPGRHLWGASGAPRAAEQSGKSLGNVSVYTNATLWYEFARIVSGFVETGALCVLREVRHK